MLEHLPDYLTSAATVLAVVLAYLFGRRQTEHERLYERRAQVIAGLFERVAEVQRRIYSLVASLDLVTDPVDPDKSRLVAEGFSELFQYHRRNSVWLSRQTSKHMHDFIERYTRIFFDLERPLEPHAYVADDWMKAWREFETESTEMREALEEEFRAALGDTRAKLARLWRRSYLK
jgi:hypothetical protein